MINYSWLESAWQQVLSQYQANKLPHAFLLSGVAGIGKRDFARQLTEFLLCEGKPEGASSACGACKQCMLTQAGTHPDYKYIQPEEGSSVIKVDMVRAMVDFFEQSSMQSGKKVAIIEPAEALNVNAANALLKTLEEPSGDSLIILITDNSGQLLPTIRSRCQVIDLPIPSQEVSKPWLARSCNESDEAISALALSIANDAPLKAKEFISSGACGEYQKMLNELGESLKKQVSISKVAERWADDLAVERLRWIVRWSQLMIKNKLASSSISAQDENKMFAHLSKINNEKALFDFYEYIVLQLQLLQSASNPNKVLMFEEILIKFNGFMR